MSAKKKYSITTKKGDRGKTSLLDGSRVTKYSLRPEAYGVIDEANSFLGALRAQTISERIKSVIITIQNHIFLINSELACPADKRSMLKKLIGTEDVVYLEQEASRLEEELQLPRSFVLYGGTISSAYADIARAIMRRAERRVSELDANEPLENDSIKKYLNRLSDILFLIARFEEKIAGVEPLHPS